jgi:PAS domain S-box-containing protein
VIKGKLADASANALQAQAFVEQAPLAIAMFDREMCYLAASRRWITDFQPSGADLVGRCHYDVFPRLPAHMREINRLALAGQTLRRERERLQRSDGRVQYITWEVQPWRDARGDIGGVIIYAQEVTAEVEAARALAESEARYRGLADTSPDIITRADLSGVLQYVSPACRQLGYTPEEMIGRPILDFAVADDAALIRSRLGALAAGAGMQPGVHRVRRKDGSVVWLEGRPAPLHDETGAIVGVLTSLRDVTEQKRLELQLEESEARFRALAEATPDVVVKIGAGDVIEYVSPSIARYGHRPEDLVGVVAGSLVHPDDRARRDEAVGELYASGDGEAPRDRSYRVRTASGSYVCMEGKSQLLRDERGGAVGFLSHLRDVTDRVEAQRALAESEARFRQLAAQAPDIIVRYDADGVIEYVSPAVRAYGYQPEEVVGRRVSDFGIEGGAELGALRAMQRGEPLPLGQQNQFQLRTRDGRLVWMQGNPAVLRDETGQPVGVVSVVRDITEQRQMAARLAESEARYRALAERASDITVQTDAAGVVQYISPTCIDLLGYQPEELIGRSALDYIHPEQHDLTRERMRSLYGRARRPEDDRREYRGVRKDGGEVWLEAVSSALLDEGGEVIGAVSRLRDITAQRAAAEALARSERKLRALFELAPVGIALNDINGRYLEFNEAFRKICGYDEDELRTLDYWALTPAEYAEEEQRQLEALRATGRYGPYEKHYIRKDGSRIPLRLNGIQIETLDGEPLIWSIVEDITDQQRAEAVLIEARAAAEAAAVAKSEFLANMSHEIRTPLTGVVGFAGLLEAMDELPLVARRYAQRISTSAETLLAVVNDVLDFSKLEARQMELDPHAFDPAELAETVSDLVRDRAARKGIELVLRHDGPPSPRLVADSARLRQVLLNFLTNAVKFTERGAITVATRYVAGAGRLRMSVTDTGVGVPPERAGKLFQRFSQVDASSTRRHGGTGLGLAISKSLIEMMGGAIGFESRVGVGSTFWFEIPARAADAADEPGAAPPASDVAVGRMAILVVDDVAVNRELISAMLSPFDLLLAEAASGAEAVKAAMARRFDLILMDLQMPGMDGMAATRAIRANSDLNRATPILAISANVLPDQVAEARQAGMNDHIAKPIDPADLIGKIARWTAPADAPSGHP